MSDDMEYPDEAPARVARWATVVRNLRADNEKLRRIEEAASTVLGYAPMGHHLAATNGEWHYALRTLRNALAMRQLEKEIAGQAELGA
jgi:hypothetical protein